MALSAHHKISATVSIFILICTFGFRAIRAQDVTQEEINEGIVEVIKAENVDIDLDHAETKDGQKLEIVKQIRKLNVDGSYTVGYEADDGTFKIESRDVLGNVKGTYGYVDVNGEIKRVSYIANNATTLKTEPSTEETTTHARRTKGTPTTRRPHYMNNNNNNNNNQQMQSTKPSVIQTIPRKFRLSTSTSTEQSDGKDMTTKSSNKSVDPTTTVIYATSVPTAKTYINIRPTPLPGTNMRQPEQLARPDKLEINQGSKIKVHTAKESVTTKPVVEEVDEKEEVALPYHTNLLRRQLMPDADSQYDTQHQVVYNSQADDDVRNVYGGIGSTARPLFTTTSSPRIPQVLLAARQRAAQIQGSNSANPPSTTEKYYIKPSRRPDSSDQEPTTEPTSDNAFLTHSPIPVQIPANRDDNKRVLRRQYQRAHFVRVPQQSLQSQQQQVAPPTANGYEGPRLVRIPAEPSAQRIDNHEQYLRETTPAPKAEQIAEQEPIPVRIPQSIYRYPQAALASPQPSQHYVYPDQEPTPPYSNYPIPYPSPQPQYYDYFDRPPVTTRDFERLLQALIYRHQRIQHRFAYGGYNPYIDYNPNPYGGYPILPSRAPPSQHLLPYRTPIPPYPEAEGMYQAQSPISTVETPMSYELQRLMPRKKTYNPRYFGGQQPLYGDRAYAATAPSNAGGSEGYLPPEVREELLYRMLMLAIQSEHQHHPVTAPVQVTSASDSEASTTTKSSFIYKKPVRSVQILGEER